MMNIKVDSEKLEFEFYELKRSERAIDYGILIDGCGNTIWYDVDVGIEYRQHDSNYKLSYNTKLNEIHYTVYTVSFDRRFDKTYIIPIQNYTEESFFMQSTVDDFSDFTFENFLYFSNMYNKSTQIVEEILNVYHK